MQETQKTQVESLGREDPLEKEIATHSSILAWRIPQRNLTGHSPWACKEWNMTEQLTHTYKHSPDSLQPLPASPWNGEAVHTR